MKKILFLGILGLIVIGLNAHGACVLENMRYKEACTGGASGINNTPQNPNFRLLNEESERKHLESMYQIPTISAPSSMKNGFPILNPSANCMFGMCQPR